jgi:hypothetical protein
MTPADLTGLRVVLNDLLIERIMHARSPSRARRRERQGHRQHYITRPMRTGYLLNGDTVMMHTEAWLALRALPAAASRPTIEMVPRPRHHPFVSEYWV